MADLSSMGLAPEDLAPAKKQSSDLDLSIMGLTPEDTSQSATPSERLESKAIPPLPAVDDLDLGSRGYSSPREIEIMTRGSEPNWTSPDTNKGGPFAQAFNQVVDMAAAFTRGVVGVADLPVSLFNLASKAIGSDARAAGIADVPLVQEATQTGEFEGRRNSQGWLPEAMTTASEFIGGGIGVQGVAQQGAKALAGAAEGGMAQAVSRGAAEIGRVRLALDARAAAGGAAASTAVNHSELLSDSTAAQLLAPVLGGAVATAPVAAVKQIGRRVPGQISKTRAGKVLAAAADDPDGAVQELMRRQAIEIDAASQSGDMGVMTLARSLAKENPVFEGKLTDQFVTAQKSITDELNNLFMPDGSPISATAAQDYLKRNSNELIRQLDDRANAAMEAVMNAATLGRGQIDDIALSRQAKVQATKALRDATAQSEVLWNQVPKDIPIDTGPLRQTAVEIVQNARKSTKLPKRVLEQIIGNRIRDTTTGYAVTSQPVPRGFDVSEPIGELVEMRSNLLAELRAEIKTPISSKYAPTYAKLQGAIIDSLENAQLPQGLDPQAYRTATAFTRRMHELFDQGLMGRVLTSNTKGGETVLSEKTLSTLLGGGREAQAAGARELTNIAMLQNEIGSVPLAQSDLLKSAQQYIAAQFQREVHNPEDAANFMLNNEEALRRFPQLRQTLTEAMRAIGVQAGRLDQIKAGKSAIEKSAFMRMAGMNGPKAVETILAQQNPAKFAKLTRKLVGQDRDALRGMQRDIANMVLERSRIAAGAIPKLDKQFGGPAMEKILARLKPVIDEFYTPEMKGNLRLIQEQVGKMEALNRRTPRPLDLPRNMVMDLVARSTGAHLGTMLVAGGGAGPSLIAAQAGSSAGRQLMFAIPDSATKAVLEQAMMDRTLLTQLLKSGVRTGQDSQKLAGTLSTIIAQNVGVQAAEAFEQNVREMRLTDDRDSGN